MPRHNAFPREFRERAFKLAPSSSVANEKTVKELWASSMKLSNWVRQARIDSGEVSGVSSEDRDEVVRLRREDRRLEMEAEILKRAAAFCSKDNVLPK